MNGNASIPPGRATGLTLVSLLFLLLGSLGAASASGASFDMHLRKAVVAGETLHVTVSPRRVPRETNLRLQERRSHWETVARVRVGTARKVVLNLLPHAAETIHLRVEARVGGHVLWRSEVASVKVLARRHPAAARGARAPLSASVPSGLPAEESHNPNHGVWLEPDQVLRAGDYLQSSDAHYRLVMQGDGNLVEYIGGRALWETDTVGHPGARAVMQGDGNLVVYGPNDEALWNAQTVGHPGAHLALQPDGNLVVYGPSDSPLWANYANNSLMGVGEELKPDQYLQSSDGHYKLVMQSDGNLVEYVGGRALWASETGGHPGSRVIMQSDGNLVVYDPAEKALWDSKTAGTDGGWLAVQPDANLVVYSAAGGAVWANGAYDALLLSEETLRPGQYLEASDRHHTLVMQGDGNLVLYGDKGALWSSNTVGHPNARAVMQGDGNLVVYGPDGQALWSTGTQGHDGARVAVQPDGNLVIYSSANSPLWATGTTGGGAETMGTAAEKAAVAWARAKADAHDPGYYKECLRFVFEAYEKTGTPLRPMVNYQINGGTYPLDIWGKLTGPTGQGTPPYGALVFWKGAYQPRTGSHVALSLGGGNLISTFDGTVPYIHYESLGQHPAALYLGWWLPT